jgi:hypothetical protein
MGIKTIIFIAVFIGVIRGVGPAIIKWIEKDKNEKTKSVKIASAAIIIILVGIGVPVYLLVSGQNLSMSESSSATPKVYTESEFKATVYVCAKYEVEAYLKAPSTAKFQASPDAVIYKQDSYYIIESYVDAQNSFGAMIRTNFKCKAINPKPGTGYCESVSCTYQNL